MSSHDKKPVEIAVEPDLMPSGKLFVWVGVLCAVVIVLTIIIWQEFNATTKKRLALRDSRMPPALAKASAADLARVNSFGVVDKKKGLYRVPIKQAMDMLLNTPAMLLPIDAPKKAPPAPKKAPAKAEPPAKPADAKSDDGRSDDGKADDGKADGKKAAGSTDKVPGTKVPAKGTRKVVSKDDNRTAIKKVVGKKVLRKRTRKAKKAPAKKAN